MRHGAMESASPPSKPRSRLAQPSSDISAITASREEILDSLVIAARGPAPSVQIVQGSRGWGKSRLLEELSSNLAEIGVRHAFIDLARCATHPDEFACSYVSGFLEAALPGMAPATDSQVKARSAGIKTPQARLRALITEPEIQRLRNTWPLLERLASELGRMRGESSTSVKAALDLPPLLEADLGRPVPLLASSLHEIIRLAPFPGLRNISELLSVQLGSRGAPPLIGTVAPHGRPRPLLAAMRDHLGDQFTLHDLAPTDLDEIADMAGARSGSDWNVETLLALTGGRHLTLAIIGNRLVKGETLAAALASEAADPAGRLCLELRFDYTIQIERTRGYSACKAILNVLAREEGLDLTGIARRMRRSGGSTLDYLRWLLEVGIIHRTGRRYSFVDPLLRLHTLLHEVPEHPAEMQARADTIARFLESLESRPVPLKPLGRPRADAIQTKKIEPPRIPDIPTPTHSDDSLMEID
jgi:hypothetical protein